MSLKTADYVTSVDVSVIKNDKWDKLVIPAGTFVKPIEKPYLPAHIKKSDIFKLVNFDEEVYTYSSYGIHPIPRSLIRSI